ncbi:MAG: carbohydrate kinase [Proteobacteria bacterium]|nr:carbohydrate kinase [Pseudomonadota bacterium]
MSNLLAVGIGEVLWDILPNGRKLGGAPANFAYHVNALGGRGIVVSRVGDDNLGREALDILTSRGLDTDKISIDPAHPTGQVLVDLDEQGVATYTFPDDVAWDFLHDETGERIERIDAVCFGSLGQRNSTSRETIRGFLRSCGENTLKVFDINLRQDFHSPKLVDESLKLANVLKINDEELAVMAEYLELSGNEQELVAALLERYNLKMCALTRGDKGSLLLSRDDISDNPGIPVKVIDTVGAGDAFAAAMVLGVLSGWKLDRINEYATHIASHVCSMPGAMPNMPTKLGISVR